MGLTVPAVGGWVEVPERLTFDDFYRREWAAAVRLAHLLTGVDAVAEDLAQDAFTRLHRQWQVVENEGAYLRTTVVNVCRSWHRSRGREEARVRRDAAGAPAAAELGHDDLLDALDGLPYRQKAVLVLRYYHDLPESEIAAALGCRAGTVKSLASRGLAQLKKVIDR
jgi:RNA polymerase sigma-70 factor (sigma-E family)